MSCNYIKLNFNLRLHAAFSSDDYVIAFDSIREHEIIGTAMPTKQHAQWRNLTFWYVAAEKELG